MWMLVTTICLQLSATDARCGKEVQGPYAEPMQCRVRMKDQKGALLSQADDLNAKVLFVSVTCQKGRDT